MKHHHLAIALCAGTFLLSGDSASAQSKDAKVLKATDFPHDSSKFYVDKNWLAINPDKNKEAEIRTPFPFPSGNYDIVLRAVGESDGNSQYWISRNDEQIGHFSCPLSDAMFAEGKKFNALFENVKIEKGDAISVKAKVGTDGSEFSRGRWASLSFVPVGKGKAELAVASVKSTKQPPSKKPHGQTTFTKTIPTRITS